MTSPDKRARKSLGKVNFVITYMRINNSDTNRGSESGFWKGKVNKFTTSLTGNRWGWGGEPKIYS